MSIQNDKKLLEHLKSGFKRTVKSNKYRSEIANQLQNSNLNYLIDPTFTKVNRFFALSFENETGRDLFSNNFLPKVELKIFSWKIQLKIF